LNNADLILDTDGDSYLHVSGDDVAAFVLATASGQLTVNINGADDFTFTANSFNVASGSYITMADNAWIGLASDAGRIEFDNQTTDEINFLSCNVGIGATTPIQLLHVHEGSSAAALLHFTNDTTGATSGDGLDVGINANEVALVWNSENSELLFGTNDVQRMTIKETGLVGINAVPSGQLHIDQSSDSANIPVLYLDQADISEPFILFRGTANVGVITQSIVAVGAVASDTLEGYIQVYVIDDGNQIADQVYFLQLYTLSA